MKGKMPHKTNVKNSEDSKVIHVMIKEPIAVRKLLLKAALDSVRSLQNHSEITMLQEQKKLYYKQLEKVYGDIKKIEKTMESINLPEVGEDDLGEKKLLEVSEKQHIEIKGNNEIDRLKRELEEIEKRLSSL